MNPCGSGEILEPPFASKFIRLKISQAIGLSQDGCEYLARVISDPDRPPDCYDVAGIENQSEPVELHLKGTWSDLDLNENSIVHLMEPLCDQENRTYTVTNSSGLLREFRL